METDLGGDGRGVNVGHIGEIYGPLNINQISNQVRVVGDGYFFDLVETALVEEDPPTAEALVDRLDKHRLLILAGDLEDKADCARRLARSLRTRLKKAGHEVAIRERFTGKEPQRIENAFRESGITILLLPEISKALVAGYGPAKLRRLLDDRDGYAILTTDCSRSLWDLTEGSLEAQLWCDLTWESFYGREWLLRFLKDCVSRSSLKIPQGQTDEVNGEPCLGGVPFTRAVETLKTPERIVAFVTWFASTPATPPTVKDTEARLHELGGDVGAIREWYLRFADREQMLVVGLALLDGLPDDLLFAGLEILVETTWRQTDPAFSQFDLRDLAHFAAYFKTTPVAGFLRIGCGSRKRRSEILKVAWSHQRRRLLATLPALVEMMRASAGTAAKSIARQAANRALFRTETGSTQLRQAIAEALSLVGLLSIEVVEPYLLDLATDPSETVQLFVANALAVWREAERDAEFFALIHRWWSLACDVGNPSSEIARTAAAGGDPWAAVRATVALLVGSAAPYDRENQLASDLLVLFRFLLNDPHPRVRGAVMRHCLPHMVAWHLKQLEPYLREQVLTSEDAAEEVARGAAEACEMRPVEVLPIVFGWWAAARPAGRSAVARREILLATVAATFGYIRCTAEPAALSSEEVVGYLRSILIEEGHPLVRRIALRAVERQTLRDPDLAAQLLPDLLARLALADRHQITALALRSYLHQRQNLRGGDHSLSLDGRSYEVWVAGGRPLTAIEALLYGWLLDRSDAVAQQVAIDAFATFAASQLECEERRLARERRPAAAVEAAVTGRSEVRRLGLLGHLAVLLATVGREEAGALLGPPLAELLARDREAKAADESRRIAAERARPESEAAARQAQEAIAAARERERIDLLLMRWAATPNAAARALAGLLRSALGFYNRKWAMVIAPLLLVPVLWLLHPWTKDIGREPLLAIAQQVVQAPPVPADLFAPLPPGGAIQRPLFVAYFLKTASRLPPFVAWLRGVPLQSAVPVPADGLAAPLPPGFWFVGLQDLRSHLKNVFWQSVPIRSNLMRARAWRKTILSTS